MINIKNIIVIIFSALLSINVAYGFTILENKDVNVKLDVLVNQNKKYSYNLKDHNIQDSKYNGSLNAVLFGSNKKFNIITYFKTSFTFNNDNNSIYTRKYFLHPMIIGMKIKKIGNIEYGTDYNLIYDINKLHKQYFYDKFYHQSPYFLNDLTNQVNNFISYYNTGFFGLIDNLTITSQYQYKHNDSLIDMNHDLLSHSIRYNFNNSKGYITGIYVSNLSHYLNPIDSKFLKDKNEAYGCSIKYIIHNTKIIASYCVSEHISKISNQNIYFDHIQNTEISSEYHFTPKISTNFYFMRNKLISYLYNDESTLSENYNLFQKDKALHILNKFNISFKYQYNKNMFMYLQDKNEILNDNIIDMFKTNTILDGGITYSF